MMVIPTILEKSFYKAEERLAVVRNKSRWVQLDVIDGIFLPEKSFDLEAVSRLNGFEKILWDVHLMVKEPEKWLGKCVFIGASRVIGQVEMMSNRQEFVKKVRDEGIEAGLAFDIETKIENIPEETEVVLIMGRKAGFGWKEMDEVVFKKIEEAKKIRGKSGSFLIAVDGGVTLENQEKLVESGVDIVYCGREFEKIYDKNK